jgi:hypothetical protein
MYRHPVWCGIFARPAGNEKHKAISAARCRNVLEGRFLRRRFFAGHFLWRHFAAHILQLIFSGHFFRACATETCRLRV